jgi:hypothetical protein
MADRVLLTGANSPATQGPTFAHQPEIQEMLLTAAQDYAEIAQDLEWARLRSAIPQQNH